MPNKVIIVLGMHRSGTSTVAGALKCMGIDLGVQLMAAKRGENDKGYFEHVTIVDVHERLLKALDSSWDDPKPLPSQWWHLDVIQPFKHELKDIIFKEFGGSALWGIKDPRMCRLMPIWDEILRELNILPLFIVTFRHPEEVALSLQHRDQMGLPVGYLLWVIHTLEAEKASREYSRVFVCYESLLKNGRDVMDAVSNHLGVAWTHEGAEALEDFILPSLKHCRAESKLVLGVIDKVFSIFQHASEDGYLSEEGEVYLDEIREGISNASEVLLPALTEVDQLARIRKEVEWLRGVESHLRDVLSQKEALAHKLQLSCIEFEDCLKNRDIHIDSLNQEMIKQADALNQEMIKQADALNQEMIKQADALNQEITIRDVMLNEMMNSTSWKITLPIRFVGHQCKRAKILWHLKSRILAGGGLIVGVKKVFRVLRREGFAGLKSRLRRVQNGGISSSNGSLGYAEWVQNYDSLDELKRNDLCKRMDKFEHKPLISILMPTYNSNIDWLQQSIESVQNQIYPHWELCIADDASSDAEVVKLLKHYASIDERVKICLREKNGHISAASNSALALVSGEWVALLDHDDLLAEQALFWVVEAMNQQPDICLIYSDEDKIDSMGERFDPYFKCDWNQDLFYSHNLITHLGVYRFDLLEKVGGFREGFEGAQDYDLALRYSEQFHADKIFHIPRILYHWRVHAESTAQSSEAKPYAIAAGENALNEHFSRQEINANAVPLDFGMYRIRYALPDKLPLISLIIPTRNGLSLLQQCIESILDKTTYSNYEILIVDNGSDDPEILRYFKEIEAEIKVRVIRDEQPFNYSALNNAAVKLAQGELVGLINNDIEVISPDWLSEMVSHALRPGIGAVGAKLRYPDGTLQHAGVITGLGGVAGHSHKHFAKNAPGYFWRANIIQNFSAVTAACLVIRKSIYEEVDGLNERDLQVAFNDVDFCLRVQVLGYRNLWTPYAELYHHESATRGFEDTPIKKARFSKEVKYMKECWGEMLLNDPAYSPNLTLDAENFTLAFPPRV